MQILYQMEAMGQSAREACEVFWKNFKPSDELKEFTEKLVKGVEDHREELDSLIERSSENWSIRRMARVDRNLLRIAVYELLYHPETPVKVAINEAIELGKKFGSEDSGPFINGVLDKVITLLERK